MCPVNASSTRPFNPPVCFHWAMNRTRERLAIARIVNTDAGTVTRATSARTGETTNIITITPVIVSRDVRSWLSDCCRLWAMLSMSFVTRLSRSPRDVRST